MANEVTSISELSTKLELRHTLYKIFILVPQFHHYFVHMPSHSLHYCRPITHNVTEITTANHTFTYAFQQVSLPNFYTQNNLLAVPCFGLFANLTFNYCLKIYDCIFTSCSGRFSAIDDSSICSPLCFIPSFTLIILSLFTLPALTSTDLRARRPKS